MSNRSINPDGGAIRLARLTKGWSTGELAQRAGFEQRTIENAEAGKAVYFLTLTKIAHALEVQYDALMRKPIAAANQSPESHTRKLDEFVANFRTTVKMCILTKQEVPVLSRSILDVLRIGAMLQDEVELTSNHYSADGFMPGGGVYLAVTMTVRDYLSTLHFVRASGNTDDPFLKIVYLLAESIECPDAPGQLLWSGPTLMLFPPHSHLYD